MRRRAARAVFVALLTLAGCLLMAPTCGSVSTTSGTTEPPDGDGDLVSDWCDNCRLAANRSQRDTDGDSTGNFCDCDFDQNGVCNIDDANVFLADHAAGADSGSGTDQDGDGDVDADDYALFEAGFTDGANGPAATGAAVVEGSCSASEETCTDPFRQGACFDYRVPAAGGTAKPWSILPPSDGCDLDPQLLVDAGFAAAAANPNNPTDAWHAEQSSGAVRCPGAAFATFPAGSVCDATLGCDPRDYGRTCGEPNERGGVVSCGRTSAPRACELLDMCGGQCGYRAYDCANQYRRSLIATCHALEGAEQRACGDVCLTFANLYADAVDNLSDPGTGVWPEEDLIRQGELCSCCPGPGPKGAPPAVCGDGICDAPSESCQPGSCPADCGSCDTGARCLTDTDCGQGRCGARGRCEASPAGSTCAVAGDCASGVCTGAVCQPVCGDGFCDGGELCGVSGPDACQADCGICENDESCLSGSDCLTDTCSDSTCLGLAPNAPCSSSAECDSGICDFGVCVAEPKGAGESCGLDLSCQAWEGFLIVPGTVGKCDLGFCTDGPKPAGAACEKDTACEPSIDVTTPPGVLPKVGVCNLGVCLGETVPIGDACESHFACEHEVCETISTPAGRGSDCRGVCNLGACIDALVSLGGACDSDRACVGDAFCVDGTCRAAALEPCTSNSECASGVCDPLAEKCTAICGDGICDFGGAELCGPDDLLTCRSDCGECDAIGLLFEVVGLDADVICISNEDCPSGICNFGVCLDGPNGPGTLCTTNEACWSSICNFGVCVEQTRGPNSPCTTDEVCASGACNFGLCVTARSLEESHPCTTGEVCEGGVCNFGLCTTPRPNDHVCSHDDACQSGACNLGICVSPGVLGEATPCTSHPACASEFCANFLIEPGTIPVPGFCAARCGDGQCGALETCGFTNVIARCLPDCGQCPAGHSCLSKYDCASGVCELGLCSDGNAAGGSICTTNDFCASNICNFGFCIGEPLHAGSVCSTDAACLSGDCTAGFCIQKCGDGECDGLEKCGDSDAGFECNRDCALCGGGAVCVESSDCASGVCNFAICISGDLAAGSLCTTSLACRSGNCTAGLCIQACGDGFCDGIETCGQTNPLACTVDCSLCNAGTPCIANDDCAAGGCNFGICANNLANGTPCSTNSVCASGRCLAGFCAPQTFCGDFSCNGGETCSSCTIDCGLCCKLTGGSCSSNSQCCSGVCTFLDACL